MSQAKDIKLTSDTATSPLSIMLSGETDCSVELSQAAEEYTPIPGSSEPSGWAYYRPGKLSWSVSGDAIINTNSQQRIFRGTSFFGIIKYTVRLLLGNLLGTDTGLEGTAAITSRKVVAESKGFARISIHLDGDNFPDFKPYSNG